MSNKLRSEDEVQAWDRYYAAAIPLGREFASAGNHHDFLDKVVKHAADIADRMVIERRKRDPFA